MKKILMISALALFATLAFSLVYWPTGVSRPGVAFTLDNVGSEPLRTVIVQVTGAVYSLGDIPPGGSKTVQLKAKGDSHIELQLSNGHRLTVDCYFEPAYTGRIRAKVTSQNVIAVEDEVVVRPY